MKNHGTCAAVAEAKEFAGISGTLSCSYGKDGKGYNGCVCRVRLASMHEIA